VKQHSKHIDKVLRKLEKRGLRSCFLVFCVLHIKKTKEDINLFSMGIFDEKPSADEKIKLLSDLSISGKSYSIFFYEQHMGVDKTIAFLNSYDGASLELPDGAGKISIPDSTFIPLSLIPLDSVQKNLRGLIPPADCCYLMLEFFSTNKSTFNVIDYEKVKLRRFQENLMNSYNIDLNHFHDRLGNFIFLVPENRIRSTFFSSEMTPHQLFIENHTQNIDTSKLLLTVKAVFEFDREILASRILPCFTDELIIDDFNHDGKITVEIWDMDEEEVIFSCSAHLIKAIRFKTNMITGRRKILKKDKSGNIIETVVDLVDTESSSSPSIFDPTTLSIERGIENKKKALLENKELIHYKGNDHDKAVDDIVWIMNHRSENYLYLWDPYFSKKDIDKYFIHVRCASLDIRVITDFKCRSKEDYTDEDDYRNEIESAIKRLKHYGFRNFELRYRKEEGFPFHDRFIITHGQCWMLGSSFNSIGRTHSIIIQVQHPEIIKDEFDNLWNQLQDNRVS